MSDKRKKLQINSRITRKHIAVGLGMGLGFGAVGLTVATTKTLLPKRIELPPKKDRIKILPDEAIAFVGLGDSLSLNDGRRDYALGHKQLHSYPYYMEEMMKRNGFNWESYTHAIPGTTSNQVIEQLQRYRPFLETTPLKCFVGISAGGNDGRKLIRNQEDIEILTSIAKNPFQLKSFELLSRFKKIMAEFKQNLSLILDTLVAINTVRIANNLQPLAGIYVFTLHDLSQIETTHIIPIDPTQKAIILQVKGTISLERAARWYGIHVSNIISSIVKAKRKSFYSIPLIDIDLRKIDHTYESEHFKEKGQEQIARMIMNTLVFAA